MKEPRVKRQRVWLVLSLAMAICLPTMIAAAQQPVTRPKAEAMRTVSLARLSALTAKGHLQSGDYKLAASEYSRAIDALQSVPADTEQKNVLADAHFGRASALQQGKRSENADSAGTASRLSRDELTAIADYDASSSLDSSRYFSAANNNAGLLLHDAGKHREALARFMAATRSPHPARAAFLAHVGDEFLELGQADSAARSYRAALGEDSTLSGARAGLLRAFTTRTSADSLLRVASKWSLNAEHAPQIMDAMYAALIERRWSRASGHDGAVTDSCLELLALNFAAIGLGPPDIARGQRSRLERVATSEPSTKAGVDALLTAYATVPTSARRNSSGDLTGAEWWSQSQGRRGVWSTVLGGIGRWYDARGADSTAVTYYEAALGIPWRYNEPPEWIDIELIFPLAVLYSATDAQRTAPDRLNKFLDGVFQSKLLAYQQRNVPRIRRFHTALGAFFASRDEWNNGPRGAIFQLERMREATRQLNAAARPADVIHDSPELLQQLVIGYCKTGATQKANALAMELAAENRRLGRAVAAGEICSASARTPDSR